MYSLIDKLKKIRSKRQQNNNKNNVEHWIEKPYNLTIILTSWFPPAVRISWSISTDSLPNRQHLVTGSSSIISANETNEVLPNGKVKIGSFRVGYNVISSR